MQTYSVWRADQARAEGKSGLRAWEVAAHIMCAEYEEIRAIPLEGDPTSFNMVFTRRGGGGPLMSALTESGRDAEDALANFYETLFWRRPWVDAWLIEEES